MIRTVYYVPNEPVNTDLPVKDFALALQNQTGLLWVDIVAEPAEVSKSILLETFQFHPLAVDDALEEIHVPKLDDWGNYLYLVVRAITMHPEADQNLDTLEVDTFAGKNYLVTYHTQPVIALDRLWAWCLRDQRQLMKGTNYLLYQMIDEITSDYLLVAEEIDEKIDVIEDQLFKNPQSSVLEEIFSIKRDLLHLRRMIAPQREMVNKLARGDYAVIDAEAKIYFRDVYDHFVRLYDIIENLRDLVGSALEIYLSVVSNRMNDIMKTLTVITTLFMPISFLSGFFGMNFFQPVATLPAWTGLPAFGVMLAVMILLPAAMFLWIRKRMWM